MRTKEKINQDLDNGILDFTHEEWHMYNNIPLWDCGDHEQGQDQCILERD